MGLGDVETLFKQRPRRSNNDISEVAEVSSKIPEFLQAGSVAKLGVERSIVCCGETSAGAVTVWTDLLQLLLSPAQVSFKSQVHLLVLE